MLRKGREAKGLTIEQLAVITRLNKRFIEALETGRRDQLPGQVYLKPFTKTCGEALDLDVKALYRIIDGESGGAEKVQKPIELPESRKRLDYRLPVVLIIAAAVCVIIYFAVSMRGKISRKAETVDVVPAGAVSVRKEINWSRPWERPSFYGSRKIWQNLVLMATDSIRISVFSGRDTLYNGILAKGERKVFSSDKELVLSLSRNDCVTGFINGLKDPVIGSGKGKLENYHPGK